MKVVFRADGGGTVGWGHLGRCAALADVLLSCGVHVSWACRAEAAVERLTGAPPALTLAGAPSMDSLPLGEAEQVAEFAGNADWIVVDHYGAGDDYLATLRRSSDANVLIFDDHQHRTTADLRLAPMQSAQADTLTGAVYQPVRPCFRQVTPDQERTGWLVALGGADPNDDTVHCVDALPDTVPLTVLASDAITARQNLDERLAARSGTHRRLAWLAPAELATAFATTDAALVSSSTLCWEALATGTPIVALQTADNQAGVVRVLREAEIPVFANASQAADALMRGLAAVAAPDARLDGLGAWRVARAMGVTASWPHGMDSGSER